MTKHPAAFEVSGDEVENVRVAGNRSNGPGPGVRVAGRFLSGIKVLGNRHNAGAHEAPSWQFWLTVAIAVLGLLAAILVPIFV